MANQLTGKITKLSRYQRTVTPVINANFEVIEKAFDVVDAAVQDAGDLAAQAAQSAQDAAQSAQSAVEAMEGVVLRPEFDEAVGTIPTVPDINALIDVQVDVITQRVGSLESWKEIGVEAGKVLGKIVSSQIDVPALNELGALDVGAVNWDALNGAVQLKIGTTETKANSALSRITTEETTRAAETAAAAQRSANIESSVASNKSSADQSIATLTTAQTAQGQSLTALTSTVAGNKSDADTRLNTLTTDLTAEAQARQALASTVGTNEATNTSRYNTLAGVDTAASQRMDSITATVAGNQATNDSRYTALANADNALSARADTIIARLNAGGDIASAINSASQAYVTPLAAQTSRIDTLTATASTALSTANAASTKADQAQATADGKASAASVTNLAAQVNQTNRNLLNVDVWRDGQNRNALDGWDGWGCNGTENLNVITMNIGPYGEQCLIWQSIGYSGGADGGWNRDNISVDGSVMHRFTCWIKPVSGNATSYFGTGNVKDIGGGVNGNPYFAVAQRPAQLQNGRWYLFVGYIMQAGYGGGQQGQSGIYDGETGEKIAGGTDYQFISAASQAIPHRAYQFYGSEGCEQWFAMPRIDKCDGQEPSISDLLSGATKNSLSATINRVSQVETSVAGKASASEVSTLTARVGSAESSITNVQSVAADALGRVNSKYGAVLDANGKLSGFQLTNNGTVSDFVITADKVLITAGNLFPDPEFKDVTAWNTLLRGVASGANGSPACDFARVGEFTDRDGVFNKRIQVVGDEQYLLSFWTVNGSNTGSQRGMIAVFGSATELWRNGYNCVGVKGPSASWQYHEYRFAIPNGCTYLTVAPWIDQAHNSILSVWYAGIKLQRMAGAELIVDGSITARHTSTDLLEARHINAVMGQFGSLSAIKATLGETVAGSVRSDDWARYIDLRAAYTYFINSPNFHVDHNGNITAVNAYLRGNIEADSLKVGAAIVGTKNLITDAATKMLFAENNSPDSLWVTLNFTLDEAAPVKIDWKIKTAVVAGGGGDEGSGDVGKAQGWLTVDGSAQLDVINYTTTMIVSGDSRCSWLYLNLPAGNHTVSVWKQVGISAQLVVFIKKR